MGRNNMKKYFIIFFMVILFNNISYSQTWEKCNSSNIRVRDFDTLGNNIFAASAGSGFFISSDNGVNWYASNQGLEDLDLFDIFYLNGKLFLGVYHGSYISLDSGKTWNLSNSLPTNLCFGDFLYSNNIFYTVGANSNHYLYSSSDYGINWTLISSNFPSYSISGIFFKDDTLFTYGYNGIYASLDTGKNWIQYAVSGDEYITDVKIKNDTFYALSTGYIYKILKNNVYWLNKNLSMYFPSEFYFYKNSIIVSGAGEKAGVQITTDNGETWKEINNGLTDLRIISLFLKGNTLFAGTQDSGIYKLDLNFLSIPEPRTPNPELTISPNPGSALLSINNFTNEYNSNIEIYNIYGIKVYKMPFSYRVDVSKLSAGVYYLKINKIVRKFIKM
jgi:hypothetical protein